MKRSAAGSEAPAATSGLDFIAAAAASSAAAAASLAAAEASDRGAASSDGQTSEEDAKRREREWLAPRTGRRTTRVGDDFQCAIPELGSEPLEEDENEAVSGTGGVAGAGEGAAAGK